MIGAKAGTFTSRRPCRVCVTAVISARDAGIVATRGILSDGTRYGVDAIRTKRARRTRQALLAARFLVLLRLAPSEP